MSAQEGEGGEPTRQEPPPAERATQDEPPPEPERRARRLTRERRPPARPREPRIRVQGGVGYGRFEINASELGRRGHEDASVVRVDFEMFPVRHFGFGASSEWVATGDDLFEGQQIESGVGPRDADAEASVNDLSVYFAWDPFDTERWRLPLQIGPWFQGVFLDYDDAGIDYSIGTVGIRFGVRPELALVEADKVDLVLFAGATYSIGFTSIHEDLIGNNEDYDTESQQFRAEAGLRVDLRAVSLGLHYVYSDTGINLSDIEDGRRLPEIDFDTNMFFFTVGGRF